MVVFVHPGADVGAEMDTFRDGFHQFESKVTKDDHDAENNRTTIEYINGEGDPPFIAYRLTLEPIAALTSEEYDEVKDIREKDEDEHHHGDDE